MPSLEQIGDGVWAWIQPGGRSGVANAGVVADADGLTVIDTLMVPSQWEPFGDAVDALGAPVRRVVLTSARIDHVGGTWRFRLAAVYGSPATSALLDQPPQLQLYQRFFPDFADDFDELEARRRDIEDEEVLVPVRRDILLTRTVTHEVDVPVHLTPRIEALPVTGYTAGDLIVAVDDADVVFLGGLGWFGTTPLAFQGDLRTWVDVLEVVPDLGSVLVPGHGPLGGPADVRRQQDYLQACIEAQGDTAAIPAGPWDGWTGREFDAVNVERAHLLSMGDDSTPPSMLRLLGLA